MENDAAAKNEELESEQSVGDSGTSVLPEKVDDQLARLAKVLAEAGSQVESISVFRTNAEDAFTVLKDAGTRFDELIKKAGVEVAASEELREEAQHAYDEVSEKRLALVALGSEAETLAAKVRETAATAESSAVAARDDLHRMQQSLEAIKAKIDEISAFNQSARNSSSQLSDAAAQAASTLDALRANSAAAQEAANKVEATRALVEQTAGVVAARSDHIEAGRRHVDEARQDVDRVLTEAKTAATATEGEQATAKEFADRIVALNTSAQATGAEIASAGKAVDLLRSQAEKDATTVERFAKTAGDVEESLRSAEGHLKKVQLMADERLKLIESLLPGATSAGLATAFDTRAQTFKRPAFIWDCVFFGTILVAVLIALLGFHPQDTPQYPELLRMLLARIPFLGPMAWVAIHAQRQATLAKRMEEEYANKATLARSFEGFRRQMAELGDVAEGSPVRQLAADLLRTIGTPPAHIYDKHRPDPTPATVVAEAVAPVLDVAKAALPEAAAVLKSK